MIATRLDHSGNDLARQRPCVSRAFNNPINHSPFTFTTVLLKMKLPVLLVLSAALNLISAKNFTNPLKANKGGDPFMVYSTDGVDLKGDSKGFYYLLTTPAEDGDMEIRRATTLNGLKQPPHKDIKTISVKSAKTFLGA